MKFGKCTNDKEAQGQTTSSQANLTGAGLQKQQWTLYLVFCNVSIVMGSTFMFGYNAAVINAPFAVINTYLNESAFRDGKVLSKEELSVTWSLVVSWHLIGGVLGSSWFSGALAAAVGKRNAMIVAAAIGAVGASCSFITPWTGSHIPLMIGRPLVGFATGLSMVNGPGLINEHAPARIRGGLGSLFVLGSPLGATVANLLGLSYILGQPDLWQYLFLFVAALFAIQGICLIFVVESPRYLLIKKQEDAALKALMKLRHGTEAEVLPEFQKAKEAFQTESEVKAVSPLTIFKDRKLWWPLILVVNLNIANQMTGLGATFYYATKVMKEAGLDGNSAALANFGISFGGLAGNIANIFLVDRLGRRLSMIAGLALVAGANVMLVIVILFKALEACVIGFLIFLVAYAIGPGPVAIFMSAELTVPAVKPVALAVGMVTNWSGKIITGLIFPVMQLNIGAFSFLPFAVVAFLECIFLLVFLPETSATLAAFHPDQFAPGNSLIQLKLRRKQTATPNPIKDNGHVNTSFEITHYDTRL